jgi:hypothetical protein
LLLLLLLLSYSELCCHLLVLLQLPLTQLQSTAGSTQGWQSAMAKCSEMKHLDA